MDGSYFEYYHPGKFQNQEVLCQILRNYPSQYQLETSDANPMTIRLLVAHDNLVQIKQITNMQLLSNFNPLGHVFVSGAPQHECIILPSQERQPLNMVDIHKALFGFFSNLGAALDRVALEIGILYNLVSEPRVRYKIDWNYLFGSKPKEKINLLAYCANIPTIHWAVECRNRLIHDGVIRFTICNGSIYLPDDPKQQAASSKPADNVCEDAYWKAVEIIDAIYRDLSYEITSKRLPLKP